MDRVSEPPAAVTVRREYAPRKSRATGRDDLAHLAARGVRGASASGSGRYLGSPMRNPELAGYYGPLHVCGPESFPPDTVNA